MEFTKIWHLFLIKLRLSILLKNLFKENEVFHDTSRHQFPLSANEMQLQVNCIELKE